MNAIAAPARYILGKRNMACSVLDPPPDQPHTPTRFGSRKGHFTKSCDTAAAWSLFAVTPILR